MSLTAVEAIKRDAWAERSRTATTALVSGQVIQFPDGRAGVATALAGVDAGQPAAIVAHGQYDATKHTVEFLDGDPVYWDAANNRADHEGSGRFFLGAAIGDAAASATRVRVDLNVAPQWAIDISAGDQFPAAATGAGAATVIAGPAHQLALTSANEAQRAAIMSLGDLTVGHGIVAEMDVAITTDGASDATRFSFGLGDAGAALFASIVRSISVNLEGNDAKIYAQQVGPGTNVVDTDTTATRTVGTIFRVKFDLRDPDAAKIYIDNVRVLSATTFGAFIGYTGTLKLIAQVDKATGTTVGTAKITRARARTTVAA